AREEAGKRLGTLQMGSVTGTLFGPVLGGLMADAFGFKYTFIITSFSVVIAAIIVLFGIKEQVKVKTEKKVQYSRRTILSGLLHHRLMLNIMVVTALIQIGNF